MNNITTSEKIRIMCKRRGLTITELAKKLGTTGQNLSNKLKRDNFSENELIAIAEKLNYTYESHFTDEEGNSL